LCILRGCMPSKTLIESANRAMTIQRATEFGLRAENFSVRPDEILARKKKLVAQFADYRRGQLEKGNFDFIRGWASFLDPHRVEIVAANGERRVIHGKTFLIATGSRRKTVRIPGLEEASFRDSDAALEWAAVPKSLIVLGAGPTGLEFAHYYAALGSHVTIIQRSAHILKSDDPDVSDALADALRKRGIQIFTSTTLTCLEKTGEKKRICFQHAGEEKSVEADEIIYALGREPNLMGIATRAGLDECPVVNARQQSEVDHIFGAGDVVGPFEIVHIAVQQGEVAARNAARLVRQSHEKLEMVDYRLKLFVIFTVPEVASVGATEEELRCAGTKYRVAKARFDDHGKSIVLGETEGFVKLIADAETKEILGAAVVGPKASELIHEIVAAMYFHATAADLLKIPHYHPTLSEIWTYPAEELVDDS
ncbi:MAG: FAD-dependent oxidoreductase, partial [Verrucomicrobiota bacterium]|nr:FAD-dependent oxidoreductase [Verrucomicrobiota bacterium]